VNWIDTALTWVLDLVGSVDPVARILAKVVAWPSPLWRWRRGPV